MRTLKFILRKEFRQIFRDPGILRVILIDAGNSIVDLAMGSRL
jgi:hypothetical protein